MTKPNIRLRIILFLSLIITVVYISRIVYLATRDPEYYGALEHGEFTLKRGDIYDRNGRILATSDELDSLFANPKEIKSIKDAAERLSKILNLSVNDIESKLSGKKSFIWLKRQLTPYESELIRKEKNSGIGLKKEYKRFYPNKNLASQILGFCDIDSRGVEGIENSLDFYLVPNIKRDFYKSDEGNNEDVFNAELTIDANIQAFAEKSLSEEVQKVNADFGTLILMDGKNGDILALANSPDFDPNLYKNYEQSIFRNNAIFHQFEPGSVLKVFSLLSLIDNGSITENDFFFCDGGFEKNGVKVKCTGVHNSINYFGIIKHSCNDAMLQASEKIKDIDLLHYFKLFGFGSRTSIMLPGEQQGILRDIDKWTSRSMLAIPMGQEISVNALQLARAATTLVNDGVMVEPQIVRGIFNKDNKSVKSYNRTEVRRVLKSGTSAKLLDAMKTTTDVGGTVKTLSLEGLEFAAKSGTAQIYDFKTNKYLESDFTSSLLTVFPYTKPRYLLFIAFYRPKSSIKWGGVIGAVTANNFLHNLTGYLDIYTDGDFSINKKNIKVSKEYIKATSLPLQMPDLRGLTLQDVFDVFRDVKVEYRVYGRGRVSRHTPDKGSILKQGDTVKIYLE